MTCQACAIAKVNPLTGRYDSGCDECFVRSLASSLHFHYATQANAITPDYRDALRGQFGDEWRVGHDRVKAWADKINQARKAKT